MWKFKWWKGKDKWLFLLTVGVLFCILAFPVERLVGRTRAEDGEPAGVDSGQTGITSSQSGIFDSKTGSDTSRAGVAGAQTGTDNSQIGTRDGRIEADSLTSDPSFSAPASAPASASSYEAELEQRVRDILRNVEGVGQVDVMIVLRSSAEKVIHVDGTSTRSRTDEQDSSGGSRSVESVEEGSATVMASAGGENAPVIEKELFPEISGIIISASGGGSPRVQAEISAAMEALFGLPPHKIKVLKRVE